MSQKKAQLFNPLNGNINVTGVVTASSFSGDGSSLTGIAATDNINTATPVNVLNNVRITGFTTAGAVSASNFNLSGVSTFTGDSTFSGNLTGAAATFSGNVTIGGTLTYQDVSHVDAVGIITAQQGIQVLANGLDITGVATFKGNVSIADSIFNTADTDTSIRFPSASTFTVETAGGEAVRVDAGRRFLLGTSASANYGGITGIFQVNGTTNAGMALKRSSDNNSEPLFVLAKSRGTSDSPTVVNSNDGLGGIRFAGYDGGDYITQAASITCAVDGTPGSNDMPGRLTFNTSSDGEASPTERLRINSSGDVIVNGTATGSSAKFEVQSTTGSLTSATARIDGGKTTTGAVDTGSSLLFAGHDGANGRDFASLFAGKENGTSGNHNAYLAFGTRVNGGAVTEKLRVTSTGGVHFNNAELIERVNITSGKLSDNQNINLENGMAHLFTTTETTTATPNIMTNTGINTHMAVGDVISVNIITTTAAAGYAATVHIDGVTVGTNGGSLVWNGGSAPSEGGSSGNDFYTYSIIKTASATYTVLANVANFA